MSLRFIRVVLIILVAVCVNACDPLEIRSQSERVSRNAFALFFAPFYGGDRRLGQENITVLVIDEKSLNDLGWRYILDYPDHSAYLSTILQFEPASIFLDFIFAEPRPSPRGQGLTELAGHFASLAKEYTETDIFIGASYDEVVPDPISHLKLVKNLDFSQVRWSGFGEAYPLYLGGLNETASPAYDLFLSYCEKLPGKCNLDYGEAERDDLIKHIGKRPPPMNVVWGNSLPDANREIYHSQKCAARGARRLGRRLAGAFAMAAEEIISYEKVEKNRRRSECPYHTVLRMSDLFVLMETSDGRQTARKLIENKVIMVGVDHRVSGDDINSLVHGKISGVFLHAMALDNLIEWGNAYFREPPPVIGKFDLGDFLEVILVAAAIVFTFRYKDSVKAILRAEKPPTGTHLAKLLAAPFLALVLVLVLVAVQTLVLRWSPSNWLGIMGAMALFSLVLLSQPVLRLIEVLSAGNGAQKSFFLRGANRVVRIGIKVFFDDVEPASENKFTLRARGNR